MTVAENLELGGYMLGSRALVASRRTSVEALFPDVAAWAKKKAGSLSGGQQRLVEFARCLMLDPAVSSSTSRRWAWRRRSCAPCSARCRR